MKKSRSFALFVSAALLFLSVNTLLQCAYIFSMHNRLKRSLAMSRKGNELSDVGKEGIYVLREIERYTAIMEEIARSSDQFSMGGVSEEDLEAILRGGKAGKAVRDKLAQSDIHASLINFLRSVEQGKRDFSASKRGLENSRKLLLFLKQGNRFLPEAVKTAKASLVLTKQLAAISQSSRQIAEESFQNGEKAYQKLQKHKKFFKRRRKFMEKMKKKKHET